MAFNNNQQTEIKNLIRDMLKSEDESGLVKDLLKDTLKDGLLKETLKDEFDIKQAPRLKAGDGGVQITDLPQISQTGSGDLMLVRKTAQGQDNAITYDNFLNSIGNTAVSGFAATIDVNNVNGIILNPVNGVTIPTYVNFMKVSFISPINSTGQVQIKIGTLSYKNLYALNTTTTAVIKVGDYVEAILVSTGVFNQTNNANYVYTNDYKVQTYTIDAGGVATTLYLESAYGVLKTTYYEGMTINFTCPINTQGFVRIRIDGLPLIDLIGDIDSGIPFEIFATNMVQAVYNGISFVPNNFITTDPSVEIPVEADPNQNPDLPPQNIIPPQNLLAFTIGSSGNQNFSDMSTAISELINKFGKDGGGRKITLTVTSDLLFDVNGKNRMNIQEDIDLSWITIGATNNRINLVGNAQGNWGYIWCFNGTAPNFAEGTTIDYSNLQCIPWSVSPLSHKTVTPLFCSNIKLKGITMNGGTNPAIDYSILSWGDIELIDCTIIGGSQSLYSQSKASLNNCIMRGWTIFAFKVERGYVSITNCDLSKNGVSSNQDIYIRTHPEIEVYQYNSRAKSNVAPNTQKGQNNGAYWVQGSQDVKGNN